MAENVAEIVPELYIFTHLCGYYSEHIEFKYCDITDMFVVLRIKPPSIKTERSYVWWSRGESKPPAVVVALREFPFVAEIVAELYSFAFNLS